MPRLLFLVAFLILAGPVLADDPAPSPILTALLPGPVVYWRLGSFTPKTSWPDLGSQLEAMTATGIGGTILDLRSNASPGDYTGAAQVLNLFASGDSTLSRFLPNNDTGSANPGSTISHHAVLNPLVVLINNQTIGAAAALAACLKADGALVVGRTTGAGTSSTSIRLPDGSNLGDHPVIPDISLAVDDREEKSALALIAQGRVLDVIAEADRRHRLNEAALLRGDDPEEDAELASREGKTPVQAATTQDVVLVIAIDSLKAIDLSQRRVPAPAPAQ